MCSMFSSSKVSLFALLAEPSDEEGKELFENYSRKVLKKVSKIKSKKKSVYLGTGFRLLKKKKKKKVIMVRKLRRSNKKKFKCLRVRK